MDRDVEDAALEREIREVLAAARATVQELVEEGVDRFERVAFDAAPAGGAETAPPPESGPETPRAEAAEPVAVPPREPAPESGPEPLATTANAPPRLSLDEVREALGECTRCGLCEGRKNIVFGDGDPNADLMFIGEGPGQQEDQQGLPFVGRAGELLTAMIERGLEIPRQSVYICNIVKCRPPENRDPLAEEVAACRPFLDGQIDAVKPKVIVSLGKPAASLLLGRPVAITRVRGTWQEYRGIPLMPTLHPAFILRQYTAENRRLVWQDLQAALERSRS